MGNILDRKLIIPILFLVFLSFPVSSFAQSEYTNGRIWNYQGVFFYGISYPYSPKVTCDPILKACASLWWNDWNNVVTLSTSADNFVSTTGFFTDVVVQTEDFATTYRGWLDYYPLPYDLIYDNVNTSDRIIKIMVFDSPSTTQKYTYSLATGTLTSLGSISYSCMGFSDTHTMLCARPRQTNNVTGYHIFVDFGYLDWYTGAFTTIDSYLDVYAGGGNYNCRRINHIKGWADKTEDNIMRYRSKYELEYGANGDCSFSSTKTKTVSNLTGFSATYDGILNWDGDYLYYRWYNASDPAVSGIFRSATTDLTTFGTGTMYYQFNDTIGENISSADFDDTMDQLWVYEKNINSTATNDLWSYDRSLYNIQIVPSVQDVDAGAETSLDEFTVSLTCLSENYTQTESTTNGILEISTPCQTGSEITITNTDASPGAFVFDYDVLYGCEDEYRTLIFNPTWEGYIKNYNFSVSVYDSLLNTAVPNININLNGITATTDSQGKAYFSVIPISNPSFSVESDASSCMYRLSINGSEKFYNIIGTGTGYDTYIENNIIIGYYPFSLGARDFKQDYPIYMDMTGARREVHIYSSDGIELFPSTIEIEVNGANHTYLSQDGEITETNISYVSPALFYLIDNRDPYSANFTLKYYYGDGCSSFDYYQLNDTINQDSFKEIKFILDENSANVKCCYDSDCPESFCLGKYYKRFSTCSNTCQYTTETCESSAKCDNERGCFDREYSQSCDIDQECVDVCLNNYSMIDKFCGSDGLCLGNIKTCQTNCSATYGVCSERLDCLYPSTNKFRLVLPNPQENSFYQAVRKDVTCDFDNVETSFCISQRVELLDSQGWLSSTDNVDLVQATPDDWKFKRNANNNGWIFYAVSGTCSDSCGFTYEYCENGCNPDNGLCIGKVTGQQSPYSDWISDSYSWVLAQIPLPYRMLAWIILTIVVMFFYRQGIKGHQGGDKDTLLVGFAMFLAGTSLGWIHWVVLLIVGVIITFVLWDKGGFNKS